MPKTSPINKMNVPDKELAREPHTVEELQRDAADRIERIRQEFVDGFNFILPYRKSVTFFGSAKLPENNKYYKKAQSLAQKIAHKGVAIITGGGPGIMEAANRGAKDGGAPSLGLNIELPNEQRVNPYVTRSLGFHYFFTRKVMLSFSAEVYLFFPGGYGTLDEFFEIVTLVQTKKIPHVPIVLVGKDFWSRIDSFIKEVLYEKYKTIDKEDMALYIISDDEKEIIDIISNPQLIGKKVN